MSASELTNLFMRFKTSDFLIILLSCLLILITFSFFGNKSVSPKRDVFDKLGCPCVTSDLSGMIDFSETYAFFEGREVVIPKIAFKNSKNMVLGVSNEERWIEVDLSDQKLYAWEGDRLFLQTLVSTGLPWWPTPTGEFRIWIKLRATKMSGGSGSTYYYLPNVPYVMYFGNSKVPGWRGYGLHGTYWHNDFGRQKSHGCINLPTPIAEQLYYWVGPTLSSGRSSIRASRSNIGTRIVIHE
jgi:hypothetical protein